MASEPNNNSHMFVNTSWILEGHLGIRKKTKKVGWESCWKKSKRSKIGGMWPVLWGSMTATLPHNITYLSFLIIINIHHTTFIIHKHRLRLRRATKNRNGHKSSWSQDHGATISPAGSYHRPTAGGRPLCAEIILLLSIRSPIHAISTLNCPNHCA